VSDSTKTAADLHVRLYVANDSPNSVAALANLRATLGERADLCFDLEIIDILQHPDRALRDCVTLTPMLVKVWPTPERRILGSLKDRSMLRTVLGLDPRIS